MKMLDLPGLLLFDTRVTKNSAKPIKNSPALKQNEVLTILRQT